MNCKMSELKGCFEAAGFANVKTLLSSGNVAFSCQPDIVPSEKGPQFMVLLERTFGTSITTRTWDTVKKCAVA